MKASSMQNHFDVTRSKCRQTKPIVWATLLILMSRHADRSSSSLYLADLRSMQYGCKFATVCVRKGYKIRNSDKTYVFPVVVSYRIHVHCKRSNGMYRALTHIRYIWRHAYTVSTISAIFTIPCEWPLSSRMVKIVEITE